MKCSGRCSTAIGIIITAYLPIFTLQRVEGRLFKPMAWTVVFALLGALIFSMLIAPVLSSFVFGKNVTEWHNPVMTWMTERVPRTLVQRAIRFRWITVAVAAAALGAIGVSADERRSSVPNSCRIWTKARSGRAARWRPAPGRPRARA